MSRPAFLLGTVPIYAVGVAASTYLGNELKAPLAMVGLATVWSIQAMTHYNNEYWDVEADAAVDEPGRFSGGSRVLVDRDVPRRYALFAAVGAFVAALGLAATAVTVLEAHASFVVVIGIAAILGWQYSSPPLRLVSRGFGEAVVATTVGILVPAVGYLLQAGMVDGRFLAFSLPLVPLTFATSMATAIPDVDADKEAGKRPLPVRIGVDWAIILTGLLLLVGLLLFVLVTIAVRLVSGIVTLPAALGLLIGYVLVARGVTLGSTNQVERPAVIVMAALGVTSSSMSAILWLG